MHKLQSVLDMLMAIQNCPLVEQRLQFQAFGLEWRIRHNTYQFRY